MEGLTSVDDLIEIPLMANNITHQDRMSLVEFLSDDPILTQSTQVQAFEKEWSEWLGVKHSVFVNSGSSANLITMHVLADTVKKGEVILPALTWVSDCASVLHAGFDPVFVDINLSNLGMDIRQLKEKVTDKTRIIFLTHVQGFNALSEELLQFCENQEIILVEDVCESHGARYRNKKLGSFGLISNFSFYYAHHMTTIEGGMVCTNDDVLYEKLRMWRSHGMVREIEDATYKKTQVAACPDLNPQFIFACPGFNVRSTELNAVLGRAQLTRLENNNIKRNHNFELFLEHLDSSQYYTDFELEGCSNYALIVILKQADDRKRDAIEALLRREKVEFRRGLSGGGNQLRQPYLRKIFGEQYKDYPVVEHVHFYGYYLGNFPGLDEVKIVALAKLLNSIDEVSHETQL